MIDPIFNDDQRAFGGRAILTLLREPRRKLHAGFTLVEMLVVIAIIGLLAAALTTGMTSAQEAAKRTRTKQTITKLHNQIMPRWEGYQLRRLPVNVISLTNANQPRTSTNYPPLTRLGAVRELMRYELPDAYVDLSTSNFVPIYLLSNGSTPFYPPLATTYQNAIAAGQTAASIQYGTTPPSPDGLFQGAEMLYLLMTYGADDGDNVALSFSQLDITDTDYDGMQEIRDGWGHPIEFIRWPAGMVSDLQPYYSYPSNDPRVVTSTATDLSNTNNKLTRDPVNNHDAFDVLNIDAWEPRRNNGPERAYNLFPLIISGGGNYQPELIGAALIDSTVDEGFGIQFGPPLPGASNAFNYSSSTDPYRLVPLADGTKTLPDGTVIRRATQVTPSSFDNIHNQNMGSR